MPIASLDDIRSLTGTDIGVSDWITVDQDRITAFAEATEIATEKPAALLCFEADASGCHRRIVAERIRERTGSEVVDL